MSPPNQLRAGRRRLLVALLGLVGFTALVTGLAFVLLRLLPQRTLVMAIYPEGSLNAELVKRYQEVLVRKGIDLKLVPSANKRDAGRRFWVAQTSQTFHGAHKDFIGQLNRLGDRATRLSVPTSFKPLLYGLRLHIDMVRQEARKSITP